MSRQPHHSDLGEVRGLGTWQAMAVYRAAFTAARAAELAGDGQPAYHVRQASLELVIAERMRTNAAISIHRAVLAGASVDELAHAVGVSVGEVTERWRAWAEEQRSLNADCPGVGVSEERDYARVAAALQAQGQACRCGSRQ